VYDWAVGLFATIANLNLKAPKASPTFTGTVTLPTGTATKIPKYTSAGVLGDSVITDSGDGKVGINTTIPSVELEVDGNFKSLNVNAVGTTVWLGQNTGFLGSDSTYIGYRAGQGNIYDYNTFIGYEAGNNSRGIYNVGVGRFALQSSFNTTGYNTAFGYYAGRENTGARNLFMGHRSGYQNDADDIIALGYEADKANTLSNQFIVKQNNINVTPLIQGDFSTGNVGINTSIPTEKLDVVGNIRLSGVHILGQYTTATRPAYLKGAQFFDTTINKMVIGGATAWEEVTSS